MRTSAKDGNEWLPSDTTVEMQRPVSTRNALRDCFRKVFWLADFQVYTWTPHTFPGVYPEWLIVRLSLLTAAGPRRILTGLPCYPLTA